MMLWNIHFLKKKKKSTTILEAHSFSNFFNFFLLEKMLQLFSDLLNWFVTLNCLPIPSCPEKKVVQDKYFSIGGLIFMGRERRRKIKARKKEKSTKKIKGKKERKLEQ